MSDALATVLRIRHLAVDEAKRALAAALSAEDAMRVEADAAEARIGAEGEVAADLNADDGAVEAFAAWLPVGRAQAAAARASHEASQTEVERARAVLSVARAAAEAAKSMLERRDAERQAEAARRAQAAMDEIASQKAARAAIRKQG